MFMSRFQNYLQVIVILIQVPGTCTCTEVVALKWSHLIYNYGLEILIIQTYMYFCRKECSWFLWCQQSKGLRYIGITFSVTCLSVFFAVEHWLIGGPVIVYKITGPTGVLLAMFVGPTRFGFHCNMHVIMPPFKEGGAYCIAHVGWYVSIP